MAIVLAIIIALVVYLGGGWCAYNIYTSFQDIDTMTVQSIYSSEILTYNIVAAVVNFLCAYFWERNKGPLSEGEANGMLFLALGVPAVTWVLCAYVLPISYGASILNTVINIIVMSICSSMWLRRVL